MSKKKQFPRIEDEKFTYKINDIYKEYKIPKDSKTYDQYCKRSTAKNDGKELERELLNQQKLLGQYINPKTPYTGILLYHRIGSGKSCTGIQIAEQWIGVKKKIYIILPASLIPNFILEFENGCTGKKYISKEDKIKLGDNKMPELVKKGIHEKVEKRVNKYYTILSYNKFFSNIEEGKIKNLDNSLLIVDEIQNLVSTTGSYYPALYDMIHKSKNLHTVLMSATPMFDKPDELALTMNLLPLKEKMPIKKEFYNTFTEYDKRSKLMKIKNEELLINHLKGFVSYFKGMPEITYPQMNLVYERCIMSDFQYKEYKKYAIGMSKVNESNETNSFYCKSRAIANFAYPNKKLADDGIKSLSDKIILNDLDKYSCKISKMMEHINEVKNSKIFIYTSFKNYYGIDLLTKILDVFGYKNFKDHGAGPKRYAIFSGDESKIYKRSLLNTFNNINNLNGSKIEIVIGSPSIKEGVSLLNIRQVHVIEPYWNQSRIEQIIGRASRYCSHKDLPKEERYVDVYIYIAAPKNKKDDIIIIDELMKKMSDDKMKIVKKFEDIVVKSSIDCELHYYSTIGVDRPSIKCLK